MTNKFIYKNMSEEGTEYRKEQMLLAEILRNHMDNFQNPLFVRTEFVVTNLKPVHDIPSKPCKPDIAILSKEYLRLPDYGGNAYDPIAIRLMGPPHKKPRRKIKDEDQKILLEGNGWRVIDIWEDGFPELWHRGKHSMEELKTMLFKRYKL